MTNETTRLTLELEFEHHGDVDPEDEFDLLTRVLEESTAPVEVVSVER